MANIFITSDEHYGHKRIIELANRPFESVEQMNREIIARHNAKVPNNKNVTVIHAGDMFWHTLLPSEAIQILSQLHGSHVFLYGNHDELIEKTAILRSMFVSVTGENKAGGSKILRFNKRSLTINHFAQRVWQSSHNGHWHVYGHSHDALPGLGKSFDIGVDGHDFFPWSLEEIEVKMETLKQHHYVSNTGSDIVDESRSSSVAEPLPCKQDVEGSIPSGGSKLSRFDAEGL